MSHFWTFAVLLIFTWTGALTQDENRVVFSLGTFRNVTVPQNTTVQAVVSRIPSDVTRIVVQFHARNRNVTLSYTQVPSAGSAHTAADTGLLSPLLPQQTSLAWFLLSSHRRPVTGIGAILPYRAADPVPGACSLENDLKMDPNIHLRYNLFQTSIRFAPAHTGYARGGSPLACNATQERLEYDVYRYFLPTGDLSELTLLYHLQITASTQGMKDHGSKVATLSLTNGTSASFSSTPGQGVIYSVIVRDVGRNTSASYVPAHSYGCSFSSLLDGCLTLGRISTKVFFTLCGVGGLFVCFFGHRFFKCEMFWMGYVFAAVIFFVLLTKTTVLDYDIRLALAAVMGVVGGAVLVLSWWRFGSIMACVLVVGLILGFLLAAIVFYTPLGDLAVFRSAVAFWVTFSCIMVVVPLLFVRWPREGNIVSCGVSGGYAVVLSVNAYVCTSLSYITLDILKRFINTDFNRDFIRVPLRDIDLGMLTVWAVLGASGIALQLYRERQRPFFPPSPYVLWRQARERRKTNVLDPSHHVPGLPGRMRARIQGLLRKTEPADERTPLLL
ncbi:hypothetical protein COCON_G00114070 [Conger conger]|uniref:TM7S3/TM198-like domain-containing protein n=1 Tax=Conger conger TaxID=82655 RepID=A0A9Q1DGA0_CONCO|nr:hypothetical protein COCON_G00114070 [Conger conger]